MLQPATNRITTYVFTKTLYRTIYANNIENATPTLFTVSEVQVIKSVLPIYIVIFLNLGPKQNVATMITFSVFN